MTASNDQPPGVFEPLEGGRVRIHPHHPQWAGDPKSFGELYKLVGEVAVPCAGPTPDKMRIGDASLRECRFCDRDATSITFKKEAHTVGAAFGNRHHFTNEECDLCNEANGKLDDALTNYSATERITVGARKREGFPKLGNDGTYMQFDGEQQRLTVVIDSERPTESEVRHTILSPNAFEVTVPRPAFSYDAVVRNLVRMSWMLLPKETLGESPEYLQMVLGRARPEKWEIFRMFAPGAARIVRFQVWRLRDKVAAIIPKTVAVFTIGYMTTVWASCDGEQPLHRPGPLPPFDVDPQLGEPSIQWLVISPHTVEEAGEQTLSFGCTGLRQGPFENPTTQTPRPKKRPRPRWDVEFRWNSAADEQRLKTRVHVQREDLSRPRLCFSEGDFAAMLLLDGEDGKPASCELELSLAEVSTTSALRTLDLLEAMRDPSRGAMAHAENGTIWQIAGLQPPADLDLSLVRRRVEELHEVACACGVELRVPRESDARSWTTSAIIASAMRNQGVVVQRRRRTVGILVPQDQAARLNGIALDAQGPLNIPCRESLSIGGIELDVGNVWLELPDARLGGRTQLERDGADIERLEFVGDLYSYRFERWLAADAADQ